MENFWQLFTGRLTFQTFDDTGKNKKLTMVLHDPSIDRLKRLNENGAGIYMAVNETDGKGRKKENIIRVRACFADLDGAPLSSSLDKDPTLIVETSPNRFHCYWVVKDLPLEGFTPMQKNIARLVGGDPAVCDLPRVMRVPGFYHRKGEPFLTKVRSGSSYVYTFRELVEMFPPQIVPKWSAPKYKLERKPFNLSEWRGSYGAKLGEREAHVMKIAGGIIKRGMPVDYLEREIRRDAAACVPPLEGRDVERLINSAKRYL